MKLLIDQNLPASLVSALADSFPGSTHARLVGLADADDERVWRYAGHQGFVVLTKDADFLQRSLLKGFPPKVVWLRVGNCSVQDLKKLLRENVDTIRGFIADETVAHLILNLPAE